MDALVCTYPLFLTYRYFIDLNNNGDDHDLQFLSIWWASFGTIKILEEYAGIHHIPFYFLLKGGILISMYSSTYRDWIAKYAIENVTSGLQKAKQTTVSILDEHFPQINEYIRINKTTTATTAKKNAENAENANDGEGWLAWLSRKIN